MAKYNVHGGHSLICRGASSILDEVAEDRKVKNRVIELLRAAGHEVYDCTDDESKTQNANLAAIVRKCNVHSVDLDISIHLNAGRGDSTGDGATGGVEVYGYDSGTQEIGTKICNEIAKTLNLNNRGFKTTKNLYVLNSTKSQAILVECCFVDDKDDADRWNAEKCAEAIVSAILGNNVNAGTTVTAPSVYYRAYANGCWYSEVKDLQDYAGDSIHAIKGIAVKVDSGNVKYRVRTTSGRWYPYVTGYNVNDDQNGYAGDLRNDIDEVEIVYETFAGVSKKAKYRVAPVGKNYYPWQYNNETGNGQDGYAGTARVPIGKIQIVLE